MGPAEARGLDLVAERATGDLCGMVRRQVGLDLLAVARSERFTSLAALDALVRSEAEDAPDRPPLFWHERAIAEADAVEAQIAWPLTELGGASQGKRVWAVLALALHLELLAKGRSLLPVVPPSTRRAHSVVVYHWRLEIGAILSDLLTEASASEAAAAAAAHVAHAALCDHLERLSLAIDRIAARHGGRFQRAIGRELEPIEADAVVDRLRQRYRALVFSHGACNPQFRAALRLLGPADRAEAVLVRLGVGA